MQSPKTRFSVIVVCLNPGEKLNRTLDSILNQTYDDMEIIVKDGGSHDGSVENMRKDTRIRLYNEKDTGIYDAMNQAVAHAEGEFVIFLNCGDVFYDERVLERTAEFIDSHVRSEEITSNGDAHADGLYAHKNNANPRVLYGDTYSTKNDTLIASPPEINGFACYRNIPCHQSCFYEAELCRQKPYDPKYAVRADYEHFLWCYYVAGADMKHIGFTVSAYEGGGFSENRKNRERDKREHKEITSTYIPKQELFKYRLMMAITLAPVRRFMAENKFLSGIYHRMKMAVYRLKK